MMPGLEYVENVQCHAKGSRVQMHAWSDAGLIYQPGLLWHSPYAIFVVLQAFRIERPIVIAVSGAITESAQEDAQTPQLLTGAMIVTGADVDGI